MTQHPTVIHPKQGVHQSPPRDGSTHSSPGDIMVTEQISDLHIRSDEGELILQGVTRRVSILQPHCLLLR